MLFDLAENKRVMVAEMNDLGGGRMVKCESSTRGSCLGGGVSGRVY